MSTSPEHEMTEQAYKATVNPNPVVSFNTDAWDVGGAPEIGPSHQPWRTHWPPKESVISQLSEEELRAQPWLTWKRDPKNINDKPWYFWVNAFEGEIDLPCGDGCPYCGGRGCVSLLLQNGPT